MAFLIFSNIIVACQLFLCRSQDSVTLCTLGMGTAFGESILNDSPRHSTVVTREYCELLRVEQKDFRILWEVRDPTRLPRSTCDIGSHALAWKDRVAIKTALYSLSPYDSIGRTLRFRGSPVENHCSIYSRACSSYSQVRSGRQSCTPAVGQST